MNRPSLYAVAILAGLLMASVAIAWTGPPAAPTTCPAGNAGCDAPLNVSGTSQLKSGNLGIGTVSPSTKLDISGSNVPAAGQLRILAPDYGQISFYNSNAPAIGAANEKASLYYDMANGVFHILNTLSPSGGNLILNEQGGNVGIGEPNPNSKLRVAGDVAADAFKDNANFSFVVDPAGTSQVSQLNASGYLHSTGYGTDTWFPYTNGWNYLRGPTNLSGVLYDEQNNGYYLDMNNVSIFQDIRPSIIYDRDNTGYYIDMNSVSIFQDIRPSIIYDRDNTGYYLDINTWSRTGPINADNLHVNGNGYVCVSNGLNCPAGATGLTFGGMWGWNNAYGCQEGNPWTGGCSCPGFAPNARTAAWAMGAGGAGNKMIMYCTN